MCARVCSVLCLHECACLSVCTCECVGHGVHGDADMRVFVCVHAFGCMCKDECVCLEKFPEGNPSKF